LRPSRAGEDKKEGVPCRGLDATRFLVGDGGHLRKNHWPDRVYLRLISSSNASNRGSSRRPSRRGSTFTAASPSSLF
jgi:hypothetical protein